MTQIDFESLSSTNAGGNNDRKIVCETLAKAAAGVTPDDENELPPDFPPESICLSKEAELDWFDQNAFLERKESAKGNTSHTMNATPTMHTNMNSNSQRIPLNLKTKTTFFGLPKSSSVDSKRKACKPVNMRLFPTKRSESALKAVSEPEPVSPKVSCMGRVRSKKGRRRSCEPVTTKCEVSLERSKSSRAPKRKNGFYSRVLSMFGFSRSNVKPVMASIERMHDFTPDEPVPSRKSSVKHDFRPEETVEPRKSNAVSIEPVMVSMEKMHDFRTEELVHPRKSNAMSVGPETGLVGMMRFTSGRRSESWAADEIDAVLAELGSDRKAGPNIRN